jgi:hypothetical protein
MRCWKAEQPGLLADLDQASYFDASRGLAS